MNGHAAFRQVANRDSRRISRRNLLLDEAARQFNSRGISATALGDVAARVGLTRAALYYYVRNREDLVGQCYLRASALTAADLAAARGPTGLDRLLAFLRLSLAPDRPVAAVLSEIHFHCRRRRASRSWRP